MTKIKSPTTKQSGSKEKDCLYDITSLAQRQRLLDWLRERPINTLEARHKLNILSPAARIYELRHKFGWNIQMMWVEDITPERKRHRVAKYFLLSGKYRRN